MQLRSLLMLMLSLAAAGCATSSGMDTANTPSELSTAGPALERAWQGEDVAAFQPYYAENIVVVTQTDRYSGWNDVRDRWITPGLPVVSNFKVSNVTYTREGSDIIENGSYAYVATQDGGPQNMRGAYAQRWQRQADGSWRVVAITVQ